MGKGMGNEGTRGTAHDDNTAGGGIGRRLRRPIARGARVGIPVLRGGTSTVVVLLVVAVLATTVGAASAVDSTSACHRSDTGTVEVVAVTGIATDDGDCIVDSETLVVTFEPTTPGATLGLDAFVVVDRGPGSVDDELADVDVRNLGDDRYRVEIPHDSLAAVTEPGDAGLQIEIRTRTVLPTSPGDTLLVRLDVDVGADGILDGEEGTDGDGDSATPKDSDETADGDGSVDDGESDGDSTEGTDDAGGDGTPNDPDEDSDGDGIPDSEEGTDDPDDDGTPNYLDEDSDGDGTSEFSDQTGGSTETSTPTPTPTAADTPGSGQDPGSASESSLSAGGLTEGGLPWLLLALIAVVALVLGWRQIQS